MEKQTNPLSQSMLVKQDHTCPICLTALFVPVQLASCKHIFCQSCIQDTVILTGNRTCPLCRAVFNPQQVHELTKLWEEIQASYPIVIEQRKKVIKNKKLVNLVIGNSTIVLNVQEQNNYRWKMFVKTAEGQKSLKQYAEKVEIKLHPTFHPNKVVEDFKHKQVAEVERVGWGTFRIGIVVYWKAKYEEKSTEFFHDLDFRPLVQKQIGCYLHEKKQ